MAQQQKLIFQIHRIDFGVAATSVQAIHDKHSDGIFKVAFAAAGDATRRQQRIADDHTGGRALVLVPV